MRKPATLVNGKLRAICDRLIYLRQSKGMTLVQVAEMFRVNKSTVMRWEMQDYWLNIDSANKRLLLMQLSELYQSSYDWILSGEEDVQREGDSKNVLLLDDDNTSLSIMTLLIRVFLSPEYSTFGFKDPYKALDWAQINLSGLVFCDYRMPGIQGDEFLRRLRQIPGYHTVPVIAVTQIREEGVKERMLSAGADQVLQKPLSEEKLRMTMSTFII